LPFNKVMADLVTELAPEVVSFHFGLPEPSLLEQVRSSGASIISSATTAEEACWLAQNGVDAIIAQGLEAGGHRGMFLSEEISTQVGTFALLPQIKAAVKVPVIAAGGIADAAGVQAALALGADGVQVGTAYLLCPEANTSAVHRAALQSQGASQTVLTNLFSGRPARGIVNRMIRELGPINPSAPSFPLATAASAPLRAQAERLGSGDFSPLWAGQNVTGCRSIPAAELTQALVGDLTPSVSSS
jgi:nitronate monooxygenase